MSTGGEVRLQTFASEDELVRWGRHCGKRLASDDLVFLTGPLGAGKTTLVRAMVEGYAGLPLEVTSPTFTLHHMLVTSKGPLHHLDGYRVQDEMEYEHAGLDLLPPGPTLVEWPDLFRLRKPTLVIDIRITGATSREVGISGPASARMG